MIKQIEVKRTEGFTNNFGFSPDQWKRKEFNFEVMSAHITELHPETIRLFLLRKDEKTDKLQFSDLFLDKNLILELAEQIKENQ